MCTPVTPAVPYLLLGLQDVQWAVGNSRGARKLARTPHVNKKKKKALRLASCINSQDLEALEEKEKEKRKVSILDSHTLVF